MSAVRLLSALLSCRSSFYQLTDVPSTSDFVSVYAGGSQFICALTAAGLPQCWGSARFCRFCFAHIDLMACSLYQLPTRQYVMMSATYGTFCGLDSSGGIICVEIGTPSETFGALTCPEGFVYVTHSEYGVLVCGLTATGRVICNGLSIFYNLAADVTGFQFLAIDRLGGMSICGKYASC